MDEILLFKILVILSGGIFFLPKRWKIRYSILLHVGISLITSAWAITAWGGSTPLIVDLGIPFWGGTPSFVIDKLSSFFVLIINLTCFTGIIYGAGYLKPYYDVKSDTSMSLHTWAFFALHISMLHVVMMREGFAFLMAWEVMSMSSFLLVIFEGENEANLKTGIKYLVQMHAGFTFLLLGFLWVSQDTGIFGFDGLAPYFRNHSNWGIFIILFVGFAVKAGFVPLHTWLPHAHPAAPSHVSGVMSGVMIKMGIYGILRVLMDIQADFLITGLIVAGLAVATGITGILYSSFQNDLKKILAYSSIENIGIIGLAIGMSLLGRYLQNDALTTLAFTGALLHVLNHSLYKPMLFYTAGNVYYATHTRDLDQLGGLIRQMPVSGAVFLVGTLSICAIPPFNGFISEFLIYKSVLQTIGDADFTDSLMIILVILSLVLIGGLSVYSFTRAFGISFLGRRRGVHTHEVKEVPAIMQIPGFVFMSFILAISLLSTLVILQVSKIGSLFTHLNFNNGIVLKTLPIFSRVSQVNLIILGTLALVILLRKIFQHKEISAGPTWGCGYSAGDSRHQYTSTSYAESLRELVGPLMDIRGTHVSFDEKEIFPPPRQYITEVRDLIEERAVIKPVEYITRELPKAGWAQSGMINHYLVYPLVFLIIVSLLTLIGVF